MTKEKQKLGQKAEEQACIYLQQQGLKLIKRNFRCSLGEIDLIMYHQQWIIFVEVRYRHNLLFGNAIESVNKVKQQRLIRTAFYFLQQQRWTQSLSYRFDIVGVNGVLNLDWIQDAFGVSDEYF